MASAREAPAAFVAELKRRYGSDWDVRYNTHLCRWEFESLSAGGMRVSQFLGWSRNPLTGEAIEPDPVTGLLPFRELDETAQAEILRNLEVSYIGNRVDGAASWKQYQHDRIEYNKALDRKKRREKADDYAYAITQVDLRRPWIKHHVRNQGPKLISYRQ